MYAPGYEPHDSDGESIHGMNARSYFAAMGLDRAQYHALQARVRLDLISLRRTFVIHSPITHMEIEPRVSF
jgi:hypothetical protein